MKKSIKKLYQEAKRFDEGKLYQGKEYKRVSMRLYRLHMDLSNLLGPIFRATIEEYLNLISQETELECLHFFEQGYLAGVAGK